LPDQTKSYDTQTIFSKRNRGRVGYERHHRLCQVVIYVFENPVDALTPVTKGKTSPCRVQICFQGDRTPGLNKEIWSAQKTAWIYWQRALRTESLEHGTRRRMGTSCAQSGRGSGLRSSYRRPIPAWHKDFSLTPRVLLEMS